MWVWQITFYFGLFTLIFVSDCRKQFDEVEDDFTSCIDKNILISRVLNVGKNRTIWVIDNSLPRCLFQRWWSHINNIHFGLKYNHLNFSKEEHKNLLRYNVSPWSRNVRLDFLFKIPSWSKLTNTLESLLNKKVKVLKAEIEVLRTMDAMAPVFKADCSLNHYTLTIFVNDMWNLNDYAQVSFYKVPETYLPGDKKVWEILETVHPHPYRGILWPSCQTMMLRSPAINHMSHFKFLNIQFTTNLQEDEEKIHKKKSDLSKNKDFIQFTLSSPNAEIDFASHLTRAFNDGNPARRVQVFDGLFTPGDLREWLHLLLREPPHVKDFDTDPLEDHDNVQWISGYKVQDFIQTGMWPRLRALCEFVSNHTGWFPYDVGTNHVRFADHTRIHPDSELHQDELTMIMYLNEDLTPTDYGETTFYAPRPDDGVHKFTGKGGNLYEAIGSIAPKFGRVAIFTNNIEHSAHPPSSRYPGCRYTFAVKVAKSRRLALIKMVYEGMEVFSLNHKLKNLKSLLETGRMDAESSISTSELENIWNSIQKKKEDMLTKI